MTGASGEAWCGPTGAAGRLTTPSVDDNRPILLRHEEPRCLCGAVDFRPVALKRIQQQFHGKDRHAMPPMTTPRVTF